MPTVSTNLCDIHGGVIAEDDEVTGFISDGVAPIEIVVCRPCYVRAKEAIAALIKELAHPFAQIPVATQDEIDQMKPKRAAYVKELKALDVPTGVRRKLAASLSVSSIKELADLTDAQLLAIPGIGTKGRDRVRAALKAYRTADHETARESAR